MSRQMSSLAPPARRHRTPESPHDPAPLTSRQLWVLLCAVSRELTWGLPGVSSELRRWRALALRIPDRSIRADALSSLDRKRGNTHGAALFSVLPSKRSPRLLKLLVTYQVLWDFLDNVSESGASAGQANSLCLHRALVEALEDCVQPMSDYYAHHVSRDDGGYLRALVGACRRCCRELPSFEQVRPALLVEARRANIQALNHDPSPERRETALQSWVAHEYADRHDASWFELAGAAGAGLAIYALFALAAERRLRGGEIARAYRAYFPWTSALATMLDSFVDQTEDRLNGDHCYVAYYNSAEHATRAISHLVRRCLVETHALENGERHTLIAACMIAMYLSRDSARVPALARQSRQLVSAGGSLTRALVPILRLWRIAYGQRST
jgi:tetraprenyl-beta-curcumene synthase